MGASKSAYFTTDQNSMAVLFKALGHPARIAILEFLMKSDSCICGDIVDELPLAQPTVSQHLKELKQAGLIKGSIDGNSICYCIDEGAIAVLQHFITIITNSFHNKQTNCC
jgi:ArsR family transcriptional regulator, arsenate/arsenite/antimonite-responsive transcriptional repressor